MIVTTHRLDDYIANVYQMDGQDTLGRHSHVFAHTTQVIRGKTFVEVFYPDKPLAFEMDREDPMILLPANVDHNITATENHTIIINMHQVGRAPSGVDGGLIGDG